MAIGNVWNPLSEHTDNGLKFVNNTRTLGRKRVIPSNGMEVPNLSSPFRISQRAKRDQRARSERRNRLESLPQDVLRAKRDQRARSERRNRLESLPQDVLVGVLCKVDHSDLKQLLLVSRNVKDTALIARELHFNYSTPLSKRASTQHGSGNVYSEEAPDTPIQLRIARSRIDGGKLASLAVTLFASP